MSKKAVKNVKTAPVTKPLKVAILGVMNDSGKTTLFYHLISMLNQIDKQQFQGVMVESVDSYDPLEGAKHFNSHDVDKALMYCDESITSLFCDLGSSTKAYINDAHTQGTYCDFLAFDKAIVPVKGNSSRELDDTVTYLQTIIDLGLDPSGVTVVYNSLTMQQAQSFNDVFGKFNNDLKELGITILDEPLIIRHSGLFPYMKRKGFDITQVVNDTTDFRALLKAASRDERKEIMEAHTIQRLAVSNIKILERLTSLIL